MQKKFVISGLVIIGLTCAGVIIAQDIKLNPIKPPTKPTALLTDEQQGILAVRQAKASVVNIIGVSAIATSTTDTASVLVNPDSKTYGTGFIWDSHGTIITNNHVVNDSGLNYYVVLADGTQYAAKVLGQDKFDDVALLKINADNLLPAKVGDSSALETGQTVFAIGNSLGQYQYTVTRGVVSALDRNLTEQDYGDQAGSRLHNLIQTDAAINLGNSGGPLINLAGEVVGINTLIDASGSSLGFAIPINTIKDAVMQLQAFGKVSRPFLGVQFSTIDPLVTLDQQLMVNNGALIISVLPSSPAAVAGLRANDIIVGVNNMVLNQTQVLDDAINNLTAGSQVLLKIVRGGQTLQLPVVLGSQQ